MIWQEGEELKRDGGTRPQDKERLRFRLWPLQEPPMLPSACSSTFAPLLIAETGEFCGISVEEDKVEASMSVVP